MWFEPICDLDFPTEHHHVLLLRVEVLASIVFLIEVLVSHAFQQSGLTFTLHIKVEQQVGKLFKVCAAFYSENTCVLVHFCDGHVVVTAEDQIYFWYARG